MPSQPYFSPELFDFLTRLKRNNRREWFLKNKVKYEQAIKEPCIRFVIDAAMPLHDISPHLRSDPKSSLFRIYRDVRFSNDKRPYKTHVGIQFTAGAKDVHAPGYYLHLEPGGCFVCGGIWRPERIPLLKIREAIVARPDDWKKATRGLTLSDEDKLSRPPRGFPCEHPHAEDLKLKSYIALIDLSPDQICGPRFMSDFTKATKKLSPVVEFLAHALETKW
ncbi:MAG TPA: DUF2461 domain-containing protein [Terriglobales bacterium]|nr:DUF2461 domain-containing protein [Terriglobales bacterium]